MLSMTGFGQGRCGGKPGVVTVQLSAVNNRAFAVHLRSELQDLQLDELVRQELRASLVRGAVTAHVAFQSAHLLAIDYQRLATAWKELAMLSRELGAPEPTLPAVAALLPGTRAASEAGTVESLLRPALAEAIAALVAMRAAEGEHLGRDLAGHAAALRRLHGAMTALAAARPAAYREALQGRLREVLAGQAAVTAEVLVRELALHADRIDISEELVRLASHLDALDRLLAPPGNAEPVGRKLEFLLQECLREANTIGAKANDATLAQAVVDTKFALEQMREQAANVA
jgi:uncharacterized protein (TIGR00255 family)